MLVPILGDHYSKILAKGELSILWNEQEERFECGYWDHRFPLDPASWYMLLQPVSLRSETGVDR